MCLLWQEEGKLSRYIVPSWQARGIAHGFLGGSLDVSQGTTCFEDAFRENGAIYKLNLLSQVHGSEICEFERKDSEPPSNLTQADGWLVSCAECAGAQPAEIFGIKTADCTPILIADLNARFFGALHCGWRSTRLGILTKALHRLMALGVEPKQLELAIGPAAGSCCYEVQEDMFSTFSQEVAKEVALFRTENGRTYLDLRALLLTQALEFGVPREQLFLTETCTICDNRFFSYRRQKTHSGRQVSFIGLSP